MIRKFLLLIALTASIALCAKPLPHNAQALQTIHTLDHHAKRFSFVVMGDNRDGDKVMKRILQQITKDPSVAFGIDGGDIVPDGYGKEYRHYLEMLRQTKKTILTVIGNHEIPWYDGETNYTRFMGKPYNAFAFGNSYFILLDDSNEKGLGRKQRTWLIAQLKRSQKYAHRFVFMHVPLYDPRKGQYAEGHSIKKRKNAHWLNDTFDRYHVNMIFASHIHMYFRAQWHKTPFIITGGAGAPLKHYKKSGFYHYIKVTVNGSKVDYRVVPINLPEPGLVDRAVQSIKDTLNMP